MLKDIEDVWKHAPVYQGEVKWTAQSHAVCVVPMGENIGVREFGPKDRPLVTARVLQPGSAWFLEHDAAGLEKAIRGHPGHTFTDISRHGDRVIAACVKTRRLRKVPAAHELVPAEVALAHLTLWAHTDEECVGGYWSDGIQTVRVVTKDTGLWLYTEETIAQVAADVPWADYSDPGVAQPLDPHLNVIDGSCGYTGGAALAVGAASAAAHECGGFVNPKPQTVMRDGVMTMTMPMRQRTT